MPSLAVGSDARMPSLSVSLDARMPPLFLSLDARIPSHSAGLDAHVAGDLDAHVDAERASVRDLVRHHLRRGGGGEDQYTASH